MARFIGQLAGEDWVGGVGRDEPLQALPGLAGAPGEEGPVRLLEISEEPHHVLGVLDLAFGQGVVTADVAKVGQLGSGFRVEGRRSGGSPPGGKLDQAGDEAVSQRLAPGQEVGALAWVLVEIVQLGLGCQDELVVGVANRRLRLQPKVAG